MKDTLQFELENNEIAVENMIEAAVSLGIKWYAIRSLNSVSLYLHISNPTQAYNYGRATCEIMKRYEHAYKIQQRLKCFDAIIEKHALFFEQWVAAYNKAKRFGAIPLELRKQGGDICAELKAAGVYSVSTINQDILRNLYYYIKKKENKEVNV